MKFLYVILVLVCIGTALSLFYTLKAFLGGLSFGAIHGSLLGYTDEQVIGDPTIAAYVNYFCGPAKTALMPIAFIMLMKREHLRFCTVVFVCIALGVLSSGGRITILYAILQALIAMRYFKITVSTLVRRRLIEFAVLGIVIVAFLTIARGSNVWKSLYAYFSIPIGILQHYVDVLDSTGFSSQGAAFLYPFFYIAKAVAEFFGSAPTFLEELSYFVALPQRSWISGLFPSGEYNAFCTLFYFFYMDFREPGVAILSLIYGVTAGCIYRETKGMRGQVYFVWHLMIISSIFGSFIIWQLGNTKFFVAALILFAAQVTAKPEGGEA